MTVLLEKAALEKVLTKDVRALLSALRAEGAQAFVVGGAVRDVVMGRGIGDIDIATSLAPEIVMSALAGRGIKTVPTGIKHGTVTAVINREGYEITTLRRDEDTDGRHASVVFTDDVREDARRRDFTFNALYLDEGGEITDFFGGIADAKAGRVRFIGDAHDRIREDVLRILRFFRFYAFFGRGAPDSSAVLACKELAHLIPRLSAERVAKELLKMLSAEDPLGACRGMLDCGVAVNIEPELGALDRMECLLDAERKCSERVAGIVRLASWLPQEAEAAERIAKKLKFSRRDSEALRVLASLSGLLGSCEDKKAVRRRIYEFGADNCRAAILLNGAEFAGRCLSAVREWDNPVLPVKGRDVLAAGVASGERVGEVLKSVEKWWVSRDFQDGREACLGQIRRAGIIH